ncbi:AraC family transcriptional regulator [Rhizobium sp. Root149]|uniref:helix-turn-helix domain-containing protein n=1 Tax=Rhizobium sp. Root149 TaxID=1736473 RepID=UPI000A8C5F74|nr:AraC family transcriptional regulator [Rhizobium sp. Root149]
MSERDYYVYLPENGLCESLGCTALSTGYTRIPPGSAYPPVRHPDDHHFVWEKGRTIQAYQFAWISQGRGRLQSAPDPARVHPIQAGDMIVLFPGVWHRFGPDRETGWVESWIECRGPAFERIMDAGLISPDQPIWHAGDGVRTVFETIHGLACEDALLHQPTLSALALQLLAQLCQSRDLVGQGRIRIIEQARRALMDKNANPTSLGRIASNLGLSYPTLRRLFREHTGMSLKQYQTDVRTRRACELLRNSDKSVKSIAGYLGYNSAFHFSSQFKKATGLSPSEWRAKNRLDILTNI